MVVWQGLIGLLVLVAILVSIWQLQTYNLERKVWMETSDRSSKISTARQDSTALVLVTHRVAFTQAPFAIEKEDIRYHTDSIALSVATLKRGRENLLGEAESRPEGDPIRDRSAQAAALMDKLIASANQTIDLGMAGDWEGARTLISQTADGSKVPKFEKINTELLEELQWAQILTQREFVQAQEQMMKAGSTAMVVSVRVAAIVIVLGIILSVSIIYNITKPISELSGAAVHLAAGGFDVRVPITRQDEFGQLAKTFNHMAAQLEEMYAQMEERPGTAEARLLQAIEGIVGIADLIGTDACFEDLLRTGVACGVYPDAISRELDPAHHTRETARLLAVY